MDVKFLTIEIIDLREKKKVLFITMYKLKALIFSKKLAFYNFSFNLCQEINHLSDKKNVKYKDRK